MLDTSQSDIPRILNYLERYGLLTRDTAHWALADILPVSFDRAIVLLTQQGYVIESKAEGRRPVYYLAVDQYRTLGNLFPDSSNSSSSDTT